MALSVLQDFCRGNNLSPESKCTCAHTSVFQYSTENAFPDHCPFPLSSPDGSFLFLFIAKFPKNTYQGLLLLFVCVLPVTMNSITETILFIFAFLSSSTGLNKIGVHIYRWHGQIKKEEQKREKLRKEEREEKGGEGRSVGFIWFADMQRRK